MKKAKNSLGQEVNLPARPEREDFESQEEFEEALAGWNHRVLPLLSVNRPSKDPQPKPRSEESGK